MSTSAIDSTVSKISGPDELVQAIPYLLGFHASDSVVLVGLADGVVVVTARLDLVDAAGQGVLDRTLRAMRRGGAESFVTVIYGEAPDADAYVLPHDEIIYDLIDAADDCDADLTEAVLVADRRWWSYLCAERDCCPPEGHPVYDDCAFAAEATFAGIVVERDREALARSLDPAPEDERRRLSQRIALAEAEGTQLVLTGRYETRQRSAKRAMFSAARRFDRDAKLGVVSELSDDDLVGFVVTLREIAVRDPLWMAIDDGRVDGRALWLDLARRAPSPYDAAPMFLHGWASWRAGNGALAGMAAERAISSDPDYSAADLLLGALSAAIDPRRFPKLRAPRARGARRLADRGLGDGELADGELGDTHEDVVADESAEGDARC